MTRTTRLFISGLALILFALLLGLAGLAVRLAAGPLNVSFLTPYIEDAMEDQPFRLDVGETLLSWEGLGAPIELVAENTTIARPDGTPIITVSALHISISFGDLLNGRIVPSAMRFAGPRLTVRRHADGSFDVDLGSGLGRPSDETGFLGQALPAAGGDEGVWESLIDALDRDPADGTGMAALTALSVEGATIEIIDEVVGVTWRASDAEVHLRRNPAGIGIDGAADLALGGTTLTTRFDLDLVLSAVHPAIAGSVQVRALFAGRLASFDGTVDLVSGPRPQFTAAGTVGIAASETAPFINAEIELEHDVEAVSTIMRYSVDNVVPADLVDFDPALTPLATVDSPVIATGFATFGDGFEPTALVFHARGGAGRLVLPWLYNEPVTVAGLGLSARADLVEDWLTVDSFEVNLGGPIVSGQGEVAIIDGRILDVAGYAELENLPVDLLGRYWPPVATGGRDWILSNMSRGEVEHASLTMQARVSADSPEANLVAIDGTIDASGLTVRFLEGLPPITGGAATATFSEAGFDIQVSEGAVDDVTLVDGAVLIEGLDGSRPQRLSVNAGLSGQLPDLLAVLDLPPLELPADAGIRPADSSGAFSGRLRVGLPLGQVIESSDIAIAARVNLVDVDVRSIAGDTDITDFTGLLDIDGRSLLADGRGVMLGVGASFRWTQYFFPADQVSGRGTMAATLNEADRQRLGIELAPWITGPIPVRANVTAGNDGTTRLAADLDLTGARIGVEQVGFSKPPGVGAGGTVDLTFAGSQIPFVDGFTVTSDGLSVDGTVRLNPADGTLNRLDLVGASLGLNSLSVAVDLSDPGMINLRLGGARLDLRTLLDAFFSGATGGVGASGTARTEPDLDVRLDIDDVLLTDNGGLSDVVGQARRIGGAWQLIELNGSHPSGEAFSFSLRPLDGAVRSVELIADDAAALFGLLDTLDGIAGGRLLLDARVGPSGITGRAQLDDFAVLDAPPLARLLAAEPVQRQGAPPDSLSFDRLLADFSYADDRLTILSGRASGGLLGISFAGNVDFATDRLAFSGTLIPVYGVNTFLADIPLIGEIVTGIGGQGIFAINYAVEGPIGSPSVSVDTLSALAPGILREIFFGRTPG
ncbi:MAG: DUF3971 domain-containing protein [Azospirillaceae bacterium]